MNGPDGKPLRLDDDAESASSEAPAFLARPTGAPVYHGFPLVDGAVVDEFQLGMITDFIRSPGGSHDAFVVAPDGSRAGLILEADVQAYFDTTLEPEVGRWGVYAAGQPLPLESAETARRFLEALVPELRSRWEAWAAGHA